MISLKKLTFIAWAAAAVAAPVCLSAQEPVWIWGSKEAKDGETLIFRKVLSLKNPREATLVATGDDSLRVIVNGQTALETDGWDKIGYSGFSSLLKDGENVIAFQGTNGTSSAGVLFELKIQDDSKGRQTFVSDASWKVSPPVPNWHAAETDDSAWPSAVPVANLGDAPWTSVTVDTLKAAADVRDPEATPIESMKIADGFKVEMIYSVPKSDQGSWVAMTIDTKERLIVSDQYGGLFRLTPGASREETKIEKIGLDIGQAQGLLYAFDSLYVVVANSAYTGRGLYRVRDTDGDDVFDKVEHLRKFADEGGEHGPHAVVLGPDKKSIYVVVGNQTTITETDNSLVPRAWDEDLLLPRIYGKGFMKGTMAPGGWIAKTDPDGKSWELVATGFRNEYDIDFDREGEIFTYDADMEWDMNTPWYRPTRVCHVTSGSEWGWRNGSGKWPEHYGDTLPPVVNVGPGSPTGVSFGYGAKFPAKYQNAFFIADWSYGKLYAVHMKPNGSSYSAEFEEFISAQPLPLTDLEINPVDGAMYFAIGGRRVQSGVYRVTYTGAESTAPAGPDNAHKDLRDLRRSLEAFHGKIDPKAIDAAWPHLSHEDRFIRFTARIAIEHQPVAQWQDRALAEKNPRALLEAMFALARHGDPGVKAKIVAALSNLNWKELDLQGQMNLVRAYGITFARMGGAGETERLIVSTQVSPHFPNDDSRLDIMLSELLVFLDTPGTVERTMELLRTAPTQQKQISLAQNLRLAKSGWTQELREEYFRWFLKAANYRGGASFSMFVGYIKKDAISQLSDEEKAQLKAILDATPEPQKSPYTFGIREFVQAWKVDDFNDVIAVGLEGGRDFANGRNMYGAATCYVCHRFNGDGGAIGPDITGVGGRFSPRDLLESIIEPNKEISDQYGAIVITKIDGSSIMGRIVNLNGDTVNVNDNMMDPDSMVAVDRKQVKSMEPSKISMMPPGLVNTLSKDDILDLLAYLIAHGDKKNPMFEK